MVEFEYQDLDRTKDEIRVLQIQPASDLSSELDCRLVHISLHNAPQYEALSYTWGANNFSERIRLNGCPFPVTENLKAALAAFRDTTETRLLWVDAVCINQRNIVERSNEVLRILSVYQNAAHVRIWLGDASDNSGLAFDHLENLAKDWAKYRTFQDRLVDSIWWIASVLSSVSQLIWYWICATTRWPGSQLGVPFYFLVARRNGLFNHILKTMLLIMALSFPTIISFSRWWKATPWLSWRNPYPGPDKATIQALVDLFCRDWWKRTWIIQEVASARKATIVCGLRTLRLDQLEDAVDHIQYLVNDHEGKTDSPYLQTDYQRIRMLQGILGFDSLPAIRAQRYSLLFLLNQFSHHDATDPKDKVYGLLGLAQDVLTISPDYKKSVRKVYMDAARKIIETNNDLNILRSCLFSNASTNINLPSWVPDWTIKQVRSVSGTASSREPFHLIGDSEQRQVGVFSASGETLEVHGLSVGSLHGTPVESTRDGKIGDTNLEPFINYILPFAGIARLLLHLAQYAGRSFSWMLKHGWVPFTVNVRVHRVIRAFEAYQTESIPSEEWRRRQPPRWHFPKTQAAYNPIAHAPGRELDRIYTWHLASKGLESVQDGKTVVSTYTPYAMEGDLVVFLLGAKMPVLIRPDNRDSPIAQAECNSTRLEAGRYKLIGPTSFTTYMDSYVWEEVKERFEQGLLRLERIELI
jgi:hypothetical protein